MSFNVTLITVAVMLLYAIPGYLLIKSRLLPKDAISSFATLLLYLCSPFQTIYALQQVEYSPYMVKYLALALVLGLGLMGGMLGLVYLALRKRQQDVRYRICTVAAAMGNCGFMGIPLLEALLPQYPAETSVKLLLLSTIFTVTLPSTVSTRPFSVG